MTVDLGIEGENFQTHSQKFDSSDEHLPHSVLGRDENRSQHKATPATQETRLEALEVGKNNALLDVQSSRLYSSACLIFQLIVIYLRSTSHHVYRDLLLR
jgi:hypothetical protein